MARAAYSPRLNPAQAIGETPRSWSTVAAAKLAMVMVGWDTSVLLRVSASEFRRRASKSWSAAWEAVLNKRWTEAWASSRSMAIRGYWAPWPGNKKVAEIPDFTIV